MLGRKNKKMLSFLCMIGALAIAFAFVIPSEIQRSNLTDGSDAVFVYNDKTVYKDESGYYIVVTNEYNPIQLYSKQKIDESFVDDWLWFSEKHSGIIPAFQQKE